MNYFAHGRHYVASPYFLLGTAVPDMIRVADRKSRVRDEHAAKFTSDQDPRVADIAAGIRKHHADDGWFHNTQAFAELLIRFTTIVRDALDGDESFRPSFLGHILVELLLDGELIREDKTKLNAYYSALDELEPDFAQDVVSGMATKPADRFAQFFAIFRQVQFLYDYLDDGKLCYRVGQVLGRVGLPELPAHFVDAIPDMRSAVSKRREELLTPS